MAQEDLLAQLMVQLTTKEEQPDLDDNTLIQKMIAPNDNLQLSDINLTVTKLNTAIFVWGGYVGSTFYNPNWYWGAGRWG